MMGGRGDGLKPISTSFIAINNFCVTFKVIVHDLLRPTSTSSVITPNITSCVLMNTIIDMTVINRYKQQSTVVTFVMGGRVAGMGPISTSSITVSSFFHVSRGRVYGNFRLGLGWTMYSPPWLYE